MNAKPRLVNELMLARVRRVIKNTVLRPDQRALAATVLAELERIKRENDRGILQETD